jgi:23S rRNA (cytosine1962-C5)-methyltransferase
MNIVTLKPGREKSLYRRHPWLFSGAIHRIKGNPAMGETVEVRNSHGKFLAWGAFSPKSQIRIRVWSLDPNDVIGPDFFLKRLKKAMDFRKKMIDEFDIGFGDHETVVSPSQALPDAFRLVFAESDGLPGFITDCYGDILVVQFLSAGAERWRQELIRLLIGMTGFEHIFERSDAHVRELEGLPIRNGRVIGNPPERVIIKEQRMRFLVDVVSGHKTGFYLDQRKNRELVRKLAGGKDVLDCFCYSGGFSVGALAGGAKSVTAVDSSERALKLVLENMKLNKLPLEKITLLSKDVFRQLRKFRDQARKFDLIVLDPPKFAPTASQVKKATRGYKDINLLALKLLNPGGILVTFSCSGGVDTALFQKIVAGAVIDSGVSAKIIRRLEQSPDHPVSLTFPESEYLKGLIIKVT